MKKLVTFMTMILFCIVVAGCSKKTNTNPEADLLCNKTSAGLMAETNNGYFARRGNIVYYADV